MDQDRNRDDLWWSKRGWEDYLYWQARDAAKVVAINDLIKDIRKTPFTGLGKPEPLRENWSGWWSRRITLEHRLVYRLLDIPTPGRKQASTTIRMIQIVQCRFHY
ncbi:Txe/YoeB family addiction module toxin [Dyella japonica]|uniref:Txe/YoeB family addiction module toxin n=1 Tax=Dyella japonica TaxID=231455 RepID=UPI0009E2BADD|nr:Txe/YoeB family addiction module toxin [Dyella japonica]